jgi:fluoride exporter
LKYIFVMLGGGIGSLLRYAVQGLTYRIVDGVFPWGTLCVNLIGSFVIGFLWEAFERLTLSPDVRVFVFVGILGGFTTFSSYSLESSSLFRDGEIGLGVTNMLASNVLGLALVLVGIATSRFLISHLT